ncbi:response regulator [candidate division CSSED10-310 bacterium]|uniref:Response regulator n=1 Tax=candidate division CSSED10-310 bacterium TaxID=2855610 RepID=A0ABV6YX56_UNCC1
MSVLKFKLILIVDDEELILNMLSEVLAEMSERIVTARNGQQALETARSEKPDLIISDIMMPEKTGLELLQDVRNDEKLVDVPFILLTVKDSTRDLLNGYSKGADYYLPKPFDYKNLCDAIQRAVVVRKK